MVSVYADIAELLKSYCYCLCAIISLHPPSYNMCYNIVILDDCLFLLHGSVMNPLLFLSTWAVVLFLTLADVFFSLY